MVILALLRPHLSIAKDNELCACKFLYAHWARRAWILFVDIPILAPSPYWKPLLKCVEAFTVTEDESTSRKDRMAFT